MFPHTVPLHPSSRQPQAKKGQHGPKQPLELTFPQSALPDENWAPWEITLWQFPEHCQVAFPYKALLSVWAQEQWKESWMLLPWPRQTPCAWEIIYSFSVSCFVPHIMSDYHQTKFLLQMPELAFFSRTAANGGSLLPFWEALCSLLILLPAPDDDKRHEPDEVLSLPNPSAWLGLSWFSSQQPEWCWVLDLWLYQCW